MTTYLLVGTIKRFRILQRVDPLFHEFKGREENGVGDARPGHGHTQTCESVSAVRPHRSLADEGKIYRDTSSCGTIRSSAPPPARPCPRISSRAGIVIWLYRLDRSAQVRISLACGFAVEEGWMKLPQPSPGDHRAHQRRPQDRERWEKSCLEMWP